MPRLVIHQPGTFNNDNIMKNFLTACVLLLFFVSCANSSDHPSSTGEHAGNSDKPSAIDTTQHATGITNQNVISTDTAAMKIDSFVK